MQGRRWQNLADTPRYIDLALADQATEVPGEELGEEERRTERFGLELRTARGLAASLVRPASQRMLATLESEGLLRVDQGRIVLTRAGKPLVDSIAVALLE